jgi:hypothetical protein
LRKSESERLLPDPEDEALLLLDLRLRLPLSLLLERLLERLLRPPRSLFFFFFLSALISFSFSKRSWN